MRWEIKAAHRKANGELVPQSTTVVLSERNLRTLLLKLEREDSGRTLYQAFDGGAWLVKAETDEVHYQDHAPREVHEIEEAKLKAWPTA